MAHSIRWTPHMRTCELQKSSAAGMHAVPHTAFNAATTTFHGRVHSARPASWCAKHWIASSGSANATATALVLALYGAGKHALKSLQYRVTLSQRAANQVPLSPDA
jgi:hypothetical protein